MTTEPLPQMTDEQDGAGAGVELAVAAHARLAGAVDRIDDATARRPSRLPGWTVGHVVTHLARNADGHVRRLEGALEGRDLARYPGGDEERNRDIESGAGRPAAEMAADLTTAQQRLEDVWRRHQDAGWPHRELLGNDHWTITESPWRRLREVEMHHVDMGLGYEPSDWPAAYVARDLPLLLATAAARTGAAEQAAVLAWLAGRGERPAHWSLAPWG
ncbi:MAG TPA: maleylpyruvate isomerase N-terminal domain-containing protein [Acidimicrobiales bacterium]|nr:maleylpyruvate isomerase N-terminal domain-containing protein [Acidimicrobiales bacterium]